MSSNTPHGDPNQPPPPSYGAPAQGQPQGAPSAAPAAAYPAPGAYSSPAGTNTLALVSFISALVGMFVVPLIGSIVAVITGHMALRQIRQTAEGGRGLALAGTIIGWVGVGLAVLGIIALLAFIPFFLTTVQSTTSISS